MNAIRLAVCMVASLAAATAQVQVARKWRVAGPFAAGKAEREVDVLGNDGLPSDGGPPSTLLSAETFPSEFARGGRVGWQSVQASDSGVIDLQSLAGAQAAYVWAIGLLVVKDGGCVEVRTSGAVVRAWVGNRSIPLHQAGMRTELGAGSHAITVKAGSSGGGALFFALAATPCLTKKAELRILRMLSGDWQVGHGKWEEGPPAYDLPDVVDNRMFSENIHVRVKNSGGTFLKAVRLHVRPSSILAASSSPQFVSLAPSQRITLYAPLRIHGDNVSQPLPDDSCPLPVTLDVTAEEAPSPQTSLGYDHEPTSPTRLQTSITLRLRCRKMDESFLFTFLDADGSPQCAGAR